MENLEVIVSQKQEGLITTNFAKLEEKMKEELLKYKDVVYTEELVAQGKADAAELNGIIKLIDSKCSEVRLKQLEPYEIIREKANSIKGLIQQVVDSIKEQTDVFAEKQRQEKKNQLKIIFSELTKEVSGMLTFDDLFDSKWLNVNTTMKSIKETITKSVETILNDIKTIRMFESEKEEDAIEKYKITKDLATSVQMINAYEVQKAAILAQNKERDRIALETKKNEELEQNRRIEEERISRENQFEQEKSEAIEKAKEEERKKVESEQMLIRAEEKRKERVAQEEKEKEAESLRLKKEAEEQAEKIRIEKEKQEKYLKGEKRYMVTVKNLTREQLNVVCKWLMQESYKFTSAAEE